MHCIFRTVAALAFGLPALCAAPGAFRPLFNGRDLGGWRTVGDGDKIWYVDGGHILARRFPASREKGEPDLWTLQSYRDFELTVDWRLTGKPEMRPLPTFTSDGLYVRDDAGKVVRKPILNAGDSGIYLRGSPRYQVNIWSQPMGSGDINEVHKDPKVPAEIRRALIPRERADVPFGEWNHFRITLRGERVTVVLNGRTVIDNATLPGIPAEGPIGLQHEFGGSEIEFANLFIREIK